MANATTTEHADPRATDKKTRLEAGQRDAPNKPGLSKDTIFELLENQRRRETLAYLRANDGEAVLGELAEHIAAKENDIEESQLSSSQRKRVYIGLYQQHLPRLDDVGVIDYDQRSGHIRLCESAQQLYTYLDHAKTASSDEPHTKKNPFLAFIPRIALVGLIGAWPLFGTLEDDND